MAIFFVNIKAMSMPFAYYENWALWPSALDRAIAIAHIFVIDDKWRTVFTALYGAGLMLIAEKAQTTDTDGVGRLIARNGWLMLFGAAHFILLWPGDILFAYGLTGLLALWATQSSGRVLTVLIALVLPIGFAWTSLSEMAPAFLPEMLEVVEPQRWGSDPELLQQEIEAAFAPLSTQWAENAGLFIGFVVYYVGMSGNLVLALGVMLAGMGLYRAGLFRGVWPVRPTLLLAGLCLAAAWSLDFIQYQFTVDNEQSFAALSLLRPLGVADGLLGALGYACLISALVRLRAPLGGFAAAGQMAFSNYIICTLIGVGLASPWGKGWYGDVSLAELTVIAGLTALLMMLWSLVWLRLFRFGPLEWLWRSLTDGRLRRLV